MRLNILVYEVIKGFIIGNCRGSWGNRVNLYFYIELVCIFYIIIVYVIVI